MRRLTIGKRMAVAFGSIGLLILAMVAVMVIGISAEHESYAESQAANEKANAAADLSYSTAALLHYATVVELEAKSGRPTSPTANQAARDYREASNGVDEAIAELNTMTLDAIDEPLLRRIEAELAAYRNAEGKAITLYQQGSPASVEAANELIAGSQATEEVAKATTELQELIADVRMDSEQARLDAEAAGVRIEIIEVVFGFICLIIAAVLAIFTTRSITVPIRRNVEALDKLSAGDLRARVDDDSADELGQMSRSLNVALDQIGQTVIGIEHGAERLAAASSQLSEVAQRMSAAAEQSASQAQSVSAAAEEVSHGIQTVAAAAEELGSSEEEIARNTSSAATIAESAVTSADEINATVARLGESSTEIGAVVDVITSVAEQINLLALNATIEAARAGAAGESFAVVASEVKNLARKTAKSSDEIRAKIEVMQRNTSDAVASISTITETIDRISGTQIQVAAAVEEQTTATSEIGRSMSQAAVGSTEIARSITEVAEAASANSQAAAETQTMARDVAAVVAELNDYVSRFTIDEDAR